MAERRLFITGAGGRLGRLLRHQWPEFDSGFGRPVFLSRADWDICSSAPPDVRQGDLILDLAGQIQGDVARNADLAQSVSQVAAAAGASLAYLSSAAVYSGGLQKMAESGPCMPLSDYGRSKLMAEGRVRQILPSALVLRLGNVAGADALLGPLRPGVPVVLDPVPGQTGGPIRSYIGPITLAAVLGSVLRQLAHGKALPPVLNIAQPNPVAMADLVTATGQDWSFGPERTGVLAKMDLDTALLQSVCDVAPATAPGLVGELKMLKGWP